VTEHDRHRKGADGIDEVVSKQRVHKLSAAFVMFLNSVAMRPCSEVSS
jgi:hypothetical protein